jgi:hypothetical protein
MKKIIFIYSIAILVAYCPLTAQNYFNEVYRTDTNVATAIRSIIPTDTAWYVTGMTLVSQPTPHNAGWFARINPNTAQIETMKIYTDSLKTMEMRYDALGIANNGHFMSTATEVINTSLAVFDGNGDTLLYRLYKENNPNELTFTQAAQVATDASSNFYLLVVAGISSKPDSTNVIVIKTDSLGNVIQRFVFPSPDSYCLYKHPSDIIVLPNKNFVVSALIWGFCGAYHPPLETCRTRTWIFEADSLGNIVNQYLSPETDRYIDARKLTLTHDGGILFSGTEEFIGESVGTIYFSPHQYIGKLDSNYELVWEYTSKEPHLGYLSRSVEMADGSIWVCGKDKDRRGDTIEYRGILLKFSSDGDSIGRQKFYRLSYPYHSSLTGLWYDQASHFFQDMVMLPDSSLVLVGEVVVNYIPSPIAGYWGWVVHTDKYGCVESEGCFPVGLAQSPIPPWEAVRVAWCKVYPNPAQDYLVVENNSLEKSATFVLYDVMGTRVLSLISHNQSVVSVEHLPSGVYLYQFVNPQNQILQQGKVSIVR